MKSMYGKIKNGKLIMASDIVLRNEKLLFSDEELFKKNDYKKVVYVDPPKNREGYILKSYWEDNSQEIVQKWDYEKIPDDHSGDLLVAVRKFDEGIKEIQKKVRTNYSENRKKKVQLLKNEALISFLYEHKGPDMDTEGLLRLLHDFHLDLRKFFDELKMTQLLEKMDFYVSDLFLYHNKDKIISFDFNINGDDVKQLDSKKMIFPQYFKSNLCKLLDLESYQTQSNIVMYNMAFIYLFTLFDELLLKIIRIICMHENNWLISNSNLSATEILKCDTIDKIHELLVEKKVNEISWGSYSDKVDFLLSKGVKIDKTHKELFEEIILYLSMKRNAIVHNEGVWNKPSKDLLKNTEYYENISIGEPIDRDIESFEKACSNLENAIKYLYFQICDKFDFLCQYSFSSNEKNEISSTNSL